MDVADLPVNLVFQSYHLMVAMYGLHHAHGILALVFTCARRPYREHALAAEAACWSAPVFPFIAIQAGWITAEVGRQPWVVYPSTSRSRRREPADEQRHLAVGFRT